jgi:hypothetical protein
MKDIIQLIFLVIAILLALLLLRQCEGPQYLAELTAIPLPAKTVTAELTPLPTFTAEPTLTKVYVEKPTPANTPTPEPIMLGEGTGSISGNVRHYRHGTSFIDPFDGAWVAIYFHGQKAMQVKTDRAGVFRITGLPTGSYDLRVFVPSAYPYDKNKGIGVIDGRETSGVAIVLEQEFVPNELNLTFRAGVDEQSARRVIRRHGLNLIKRDPESGDYIVKLPRGKYVPDMINEMKEDKAVRDAVPNYYIYYHE